MKVFKKVIWWAMIVLSVGLIIYAKCEERRLDKEIDEILNGNLGIKDPEDEPGVRFVSDEVEGWMKGESN